MYSEPGKYACDFCVVEKGDIFHLFHIRGDRERPEAASLLDWQQADIGHATSSDLVSWRPHEPIIPVGPPGSFDKKKVYAPHVVKRKETYYMFYIMG